ncbi:MAG: hypothetical protein FJ145_25195 [Deltaproteobacteria bacterium]|nr:hypothetical protein [Deltaproteobacteria bacterium]
MKKITFIATAALATSITAYRPPSYGDDAKPYTLRKRACDDKIELSSTRNMLADDVRKTPSIAEDLAERISPWERLAVNNLKLSLSYSFTNKAGVSDVADGQPTPRPTITGTNAFQLSFGYSDKPIAKQIRAIISGDLDGREECMREGTLWEDLFFNALKFNANIAEERTLKKTANLISRSLTTRPTYQVGIKYELPLDQIWGHFRFLGRHRKDGGLYVNESLPAKKLEQGNEK